MEQIEYDGREIRMDSREVENPIESCNEPHVACILLLDTSGSMAGAAIESLNEGINRFKAEVNMDPIARKRVDVAIVEFNSDVNVVQPFTPITQMETVRLSAHGGTAMGAGISQAIDLLKQRNLFYHNIGTPVFKPWIFMITDGEPTDSIEGAIARVKLEESKHKYGKLKFFALGVPGYNKESLFRITNRVMELREAEFSRIFHWLSESMIEISTSTVNMEATLSELPEDARKADPSRDVSDW